MRKLIILAAALCLVAGACSKPTQEKTGGDLKAAAGNLKDAVKEGAASAPAGELKENVKDLAADTGTALKEGAGELKEGAKDAKAALDKSVQEQKAREKQ